MPRKCFYFVIFFILFCLTSFAQTIKIEGLVLDKNNIPIEGCSILIKKNNEILKYDYSDKKGNFFIEFQKPNNDSLNISANILGFKKQTKLIKLEKNNFNYNIKFILQEKIEHLKEVVLEPSAKIKREDNKFIYKVDAFKNGDEQTVEDILKKIPGIEVLENGRIKAHGRYIDKLLIEGDDMFDKNYTILSKNLDAKVLENIEILEGFEDNPVLKKVLNSSKVAINLKLKSQYKNIWFGNINVGLGINNRHNLGSNVGLIREKIKLFNFNSLSNLGNISSEQILVNETDNEIRFDSKKTNTIKPIYNYSDNKIPFLKNEESTFNKAFINSLSFFKKIKNKIKIRGSGYITSDLINQFSDNKTIFNTNDSITYNEVSNLKVEDKIIGLDSEISFSNTEKSYINNNLSFRSAPNKSSQHIDFNQTKIDQSINKRDVSLFNHLNYSKLLNDKKLLHNYFYFGYTKINQKVNIKSPDLNNLFFQNNNQIAHNNSRDKSILIGINSTYSFNINKYKLINTFGYESKNINRVNRFTYNNAVVDTLSNNLKIKLNNYSIKTNFKNSITKHIEINSHIALNYIKLNNKEHFLVNPKIGLRFKNLKIGSFYIEYHKDFSIPESDVFFDNFQIYDFQSFVKGSKDILLLKKETYRFNYHISNELQTQTFSINTQYIKSKQRYTTNNLINSSFSFRTYEFVSGSDMFISKIELVSYFKKMNFSTSLGSLQNISIIPIKLNSNNFNTLTFVNSNYYISGRSYFKTPLNFNFSVNLINNKSKLNNSKNKSNWVKTNLKLNYKISKTFNSFIDFNSYAFKNNSFYFLNFNLNYNPKQSRFSYHLLINNILNQKNFTLTNVSELSSFISTSPLISRYIFGSVKYRF